MNIKTDIEMIFSDSKGVMKARDIARTMICVYFKNNYRYLPFDDMKPDNLDGWLCYPDRYEEYEKISAFKLLWNNYRIDFRPLRRTMTRTYDFPHREEAEELLSHIRHDGCRFLFYDTDIDQNRQIEHRYYEDFFSMFCFILAVVSPDIHFEGICRTVEKSYAKRILTHVIYNGNELTFEQMEGDPVYGTVIVSWTLVNDLFVKHTRNFPSILVELITENCDAVKQDKELNQWIQSINDVQMEMASAQLCFRHASYPHVMLYASSRDICVKNRDSLLTLLAEKNYQTRIFSILQENECQGHHILVPDSVTKIGHRTFFRNKTLQTVEIPDSVTEIEDDAFRGCSTDLVIRGKKGSTAERYALKKGFSFTETD